MSLKEKFSTSDLPKTIDVCGNEVSLLVSNKNCEVLFDTLPSKSILEDGILNNECTGFLMSFESFYISCILKSTNRSKYDYSLLVYNESHIPNANIHTIICWSPRVMNSWVHRIQLAGFCVLHCVFA